MTKVLLPWPPSANRLWRHRGKRVYRDPKYMAWITEAGWIVKTAGFQKKIIGPFRCEIALTPPDKRKRDLDNTVKPILDLFQTVGIIENDQWCHLLIVRLDLDAAKCGACVTVSPMRP